VDKLRDPCDYCETSGLIEDMPGHFVECSECRGVGFQPTSEGSQILLFLTRFNFVRQEQLVGLKPWRGGEKRTKD